jgi:putative redox protein
MAVTNDPWREVVADWQGGTAFIANNGKGGSVEIGHFDGEQRLSAMELLLAGMAGCTGADVASILEKMRQPVEKMNLLVRGKRAETHPKAYTEIEVTYFIWGNGIDPKSVEQAIQLSIEKYCSASAMLKAVADVKTSFQIFSQDEQLEPELLSSDQHPGNP